jgi:hypothetical protein
VRTFVIGIALGALSVPLSIYVYFVCGSAPVATSAASMT